MDVASPRLAPAGQTKRNADGETPSLRHRMTKKVRHGITVKEKLHWLKMQDAQPDLGNRALAKLAKVQPCQIRDWKKLRERLEVASSCRRRLVGSGRKAKYPFMERAVYRHFLSHRAKGLAVLDDVNDLVDDEVVVNPFYAEAPVPPEELQAAEEDDAAEEAAEAVEEEWNAHEEGGEAGECNDDDDDWWRPGRYDGEECEEWNAGADEQVTVRQCIVRLADAVSEFVIHSLQIPTAKQHTTFADEQGEGCMLAAGRHGDCGRRRGRGEAEHRLPPSSLPSSPFFPPSSSLLTCSLPLYRPSPLPLCPAFPPLPPLIYFTPFLPFLFPPASPSFPPLLPLILPPAVHYASPLLTHLSSCSPSSPLLTPPSSPVYPLFLLSFLLNSSEPQLPVLLDKGTRDGKTRWKGGKAGNRRKDTLPPSVPPPLCPPPLSLPLCPFPLLSLPLCFPPPLALPPSIPPPHCPSPCVPPLLSIPLSVPPPICPSPPVSPPLSHPLGENEGGSAGKEQEQVGVETKGVPERGGVHGWERRGTWGKRWLTWCVALTYLWMGVNMAEGGGKQGRGRGNAWQKEGGSRAEGGGKQGIGRGEKGRREGGSREEGGGKCGGGSEEARGRDGRSREEGGGKQGGGRGEAGRREWGSR
ncbi:unnamed protein product [Closterium sp. NIES-64]|nr:unnamed protein product [Closterium sp. NIES-64]